jgi:hypothetical protein
MPAVSSFLPPVQAWAHNSSYVALASEFVSLEFSKFPTSKRETNGQKRIKYGGEKNKIRSRNKGKNVNRERKNGRKMSKNIQVIINSLLTPCEFVAIANYLLPGYMFHCDKLHQARNSK